jgi:hypothetical protein
MFRCHGPRAGQRCPPAAGGAGATRDDPEPPGHQSERGRDGVQQPRPRLGHRRLLQSRLRHWPTGGVYGGYLKNAQGEDIVAGIHDMVPLAELETIDTQSYDQLPEIKAPLAVIPEPPGGRARPVTTPGQHKSGRHG